MSKAEIGLSRRATLDDVAERAGVSPKTVSRVLNRSPNVKIATRERVEKAIESLGYRPNSPARMLAGNRTYLIGLVYHNHSSYITSIQEGVLEACRSAHYDLLLHPCDYSSDNLIEHIRDFLEGPRVDGLILVPPLSDVAGVLRFVADLGVPKVSISRDPSDSTDCTVATNDREVCKEMVKHLARLGHERIAFVCGHPDHTAMMKRYNGYIDGMKENDFDIDEALVFDGDFTFESGIDAGVRIMRLKENRPTAVFCANDLMAAGVLTVAHERGLSIPRDLSVAGFDNMPLAEQFWPRLTTIRQPLEEMARLATNQLLTLMQGGLPEHTQIVVDSELIVRDSTGPIKVSHR